MPSTPTQTEITTMTTTPTHQDEEETAEDATIEEQIDNDTPQQEDILMLTGPLNC
jgi:hypothetical protein